MFGLNWVDIAIIGLLVSSIYIGYRLGAMSLIIVSGCFFGTLAFSGWLYPKLLPINDRGLLTIVNTNLVLTTAIIAGGLSLKLNQRLHLKIKRARLSSFDKMSGSLVALVSMAILSWLLLASLVRMPFVRLSNSVNSSTYAQLFSTILPRTPAVFATFNNHVNPNNPPFMFYDRSPEANFPYQSSVYSKSSDGAAQSVVMITGLGCGGIVTASGFAVGDDLIMTAAHVIAGLSNPVINHNGISYNAKPVLFDANLDLAILRVDESDNDLEAPVLELMHEPLADDTTVSVIGYPSGRFTAGPGILHENRPVFGHNIYDTGYYGRDIYVVQTYVETGVSGGPVVAPDGKVAGMIYAKLDGHDDLAFALASPRLTGPLEDAKGNHVRTGVGICVSD